MCLTEVNVQHGSIGSLDQNVSWFVLKELVHEAHSVHYHWADNIAVSLQEVNGKVVY